MAISKIIKQNKTSHEHRPPKVAAKLCKTKQNQDIYYSNLTINQTNQIPSAQATPINQ